MTDNKHHNLPPINVDDGNNPRENNNNNKRPKITRETSGQIDEQNQRWPYCLVWTPLPLITWLFPWIGHAGLANSKGIIYDFSDDYNVSIDNFSFGTPTKYYQFNEHLVPANYSPNQSPNGSGIGGNRGVQPTRSASSSANQAWDKAIKDEAENYSHTRHSLFFNNCHNYIADILNRVKYQQKTNWSQVDVWWLITFKSRYVGWLGFVRQWAPFAFVVTVIAVIIMLMTG